MRSVFLPTFQEMYDEMLEMYDKKYDELQEVMKQNVELQKVSFLLTALVTHQSFPRKCLNL